VARQPNYGFDKRRKELERKQKQEEKRQRKEEARQNDEPSATPPADEAAKLPPEQ
jgi:hypothetical protein